MDVYRRAMPIDVSVILLTMDSSPYLDTALASLVSQSYTRGEYEIIVVDGSGDGDAAPIVQKWSNFRSIKYVPYRSTGTLPVPATLGNLAAREARGELLIFEDDFAWCASDFVAEHGDSYRQVENMITVGSVREIISNEERETPPFSDAGALLSMAHTREVQAMRRMVDFEAYPRDLERRSTCRGGDVFTTYSPELTGFDIPWVFFDTKNISVSREWFFQVGMFDEEFQTKSLANVELGYRLHRAGGRFRYAEGAINYCPALPNEDSENNRWEDFAAKQAGDYRRLIAKHPYIEVYLYWRLMAGLLTADQCNRILQEFWNARQRAEYARQTDDYIALNRRLAESCAANTGWSEEVRNLLQNYAGSV
jgi:GT2 family glycosyltransferase